MVLLCKAEKTERRKKNDLILPTICCRSRRLLRFLGKLRVAVWKIRARYLIVRNVPALGCGNDLMSLFATYGDVEECKPMDAEDCEQFTDVYWIKFCLVSNARFAKRKLDETAFMGNRLQVSFAPHFESLEDTKQKLEGRRKEVLSRLNPNKSRGAIGLNLSISNEAASASTPSHAHGVIHQMNTKKRDPGELELRSHINMAPVTRVSSDKDYFTSHSMNQTVHSVREKLNKVQASGAHLPTGVASKKPASGDHLPTGPASKKPRVDNRRRI